MTPATEPTFIARMEGERIVYYRSGGASRSEAFWSDHWAGIVADSNFYRRYQRGFLGSYRKLFTRHLTKSAPILEAGCGLSQYVIAMRELGYDCRGIDSAAETITQVQKQFPDLPVEIGDICKLPYSDGALGGYISLGVVEHFQDGPEKPLLEARRALAPEGVGIIAVPVSIPWRRKALIGEDEALAPDAEFYQYAFPPEEFEAILTNVGFSIEAKYGFGTHYALRSGSRVFRRALKWFPGLRAIDRVLDGTRVSRRYGRTQAWVVRNSERPYSG